MELVKIEKNITIDVAINSTRNAVYAKQNEEIAIRTVTGILLMATEFFNVSSPMTEVQAVQTAALFLDQYPAETIEDLILCLKNAKLGRYGKIYKGIDGKVIFDWFGQYLQEKYERFEQIKQAEKIESSERMKANFSQPQIEALKKITAKSVEITGEDTQVIRMTDKRHFEETQAYVKTLNAIELEGLRKYYTQMNNVMMFSNFNNYIEWIDNQLDILKSKQNDRSKQN